MDLKTYLQILWRRKWVIVLTAAATILVVIAGTLMMTPIYTASSILRVATPSTGTFQVNDYELPYADRLMNTYANIATSNPVLDELAQRLEVDNPPQVEVDILANTELMRITVEDQHPGVAAEAANLVAEILIDRSRELDAGSGQTAREILNEQLVQVREELDQALQEYEELVAQFPADSERVLAAGRVIDLKQGIYSTLLQQYEQARFREAVEIDTLSIIEPATIPRWPSSPRMPLNLALGAIIGLVGGVGLAFLFENLDTRLYTTEQIETVTGMPTLGKIPNVPRRRQIAYFNGTSPEGEALRHLRTTLFGFEREVPLQALLVTSAEPEEGKSTVAASLALATVQSGRKVIVVDGDLRLPTLHERFGLANKRGLSTVLRQEVALDEAIQDTEIPRLQVLTSGPLPPNPAELLGSSQMAGLIAQLKEQFDVVLLDAPALLAVTDAATLAPLADGVVLIVGRSRVRREAVQAARRQLENVKARLIGVVVNRADDLHHYNYYRKEVVEVA